MRIKLNDKFIRQICNILNDFVPWYLVLTQVCLRFPAGR